MVNSLTAYGQVLQYFNASSYFKDGLQNSECFLVLLNQFEFFLFDTRYMMEQENMLNESTLKGIGGYKGF